MYSIIHSNAKGVRRIDPADIAVPPGFKTDVFTDGLTTPINITMTDNGEMLVADAGVADGNGKVLKLVNDRFETIADGFRPPLTGITCYKGDIYVAHRGFITVIRPNGSKVDVLSGLPSWGDHHNNRVVFGADGKMYFGQGTATNSGVVGEDNEWFSNYPFFHDYPGCDIELRGFNFITQNPQSKAPSDMVCTGAYQPFGVPGRPGEKIRGIARASGSILRANPDGSCLELVAWGLRNPFRIRFDSSGRLFAANHGMDVRGSRPVANAPDEFQLIRYGAWYGWPDYTGGMPVTMPQFKPEGKPRPEFLLANHPMRPPTPLANFVPHSAIMGFEFNHSPAFGPTGNAFIAEYGSEAPETTGGLPLPGVGHRVSTIDMQTGRIATFAINKSGYAASYTGGGGFERPIDILFSDRDELFVSDFGLTQEEDGGFVQGTGVIWRITRA